MPLDVFAALGALVRAEAARSGKNPTGKKAAGKSPAGVTRTGKPAIPRPAGEPAPDHTGVPVPPGPEGAPAGSDAPPGPPVARGNRLFRALRRVVRKLTAIFR
ncbi:hypothetical protein [Streptomyces sp. NPDC101150]|uniref:hypothetical protein n=1 Tax=Streptomyces sp. NPDC101150 TaxID=3366114 RepID=UPI003817A310